MMQEIQHGDEIEYLRPDGMRGWGKALHGLVIRKADDVIIVSSLIDDASTPIPVRAGRVLAVHRVEPGHGTITFSVPAVMRQTVEGGKLTLEWYEGSEKHAKTFSAEETQALLSLLYDNRSEIMQASREET